MSLTIEFDSPSALWLQQNWPPMLIATWLVVSCLVGLYAARRYYAMPLTSNGEPPDKGMAFMILWTAPLWVPLTPLFLIHCGIMLLITTGNKPPEAKEVP